jgi:methyltransferase (TIGR00027 family)
VQVDRPSTTAEMVCSWRAIEALLPPAERILDDVHARAFLGQGRGALVDVAERLPPRAVLALARRADRVLQGAMTFCTARHRSGDELIRSSEGLEQVVLLGAGYDSRRVRLHEALAGVTLFEVDHPATAARRARLQEAAWGDEPRADAIPVTVDFNRESLEERLLECGLDASKRTLWLWEGVSMYLEEPAVRSTLDLVRRLSPPGSLLGCDVWCPPTGTLLRKLTQRDLPSLAFRLVYSESLDWSLPAAEVEPFFREHGLAVLEQVADRELIQRYAPGRRTGLLEVGLSMQWVVAEVDRPL